MKSFIKIAGIGILFLGGIIFMSLSKIYPQVEARNIPINPLVLHNSTNIASPNGNSYVPQRNNSPSIMQPKFQKMRKDLNTDSILGHLKIGETVINYPVVQWQDNNYYTDKDIYGNKTIEGSIYLDFENNINKEDRNTIIYGHNMNKNYMFHSLRYYYDNDFYNENKYITFDTIYGNQTWEIFAFYKTDIKFNYIKVNFNSDDDFMKLVYEMQEKSLIDTGVNVTSKDRILTLSTCSNQELDTRLVVNAKLVSSNNFANVNPNMFFE